MNVKFNLKAEFTGKAEMDHSNIQDRLQDRIRGTKFADTNVSLVLEAAKLSCPPGFVLKRNKCGMFLVIF